MRTAGTRLRCRATSPCRSWPGSRWAASWCAARRRSPAPSHSQVSPHHRNISTLACTVRVPRTFHPLGITHYIVLHTGLGYQIKVRTAPQQFREYFLRNFVHRWIGTTFLNYHCVHCIFKTSFYCIIYWIDQTNPISECKEEEVVGCSRSCKSRRVN